MLFDLLWAAEFKGDLLMVESVGFHHIVLNERQVEELASCADLG